MNQISLQKLVDLFTELDLSIYDVKGSPACLDLLEEIGLDFRGDEIIHVNIPEQLERPHYSLECFNVGDSYDQTIGYCSEERAFIITTPADYAEKYEKQYCDENCYIRCPNCGEYVADLENEYLPVNCENCGEEVRDAEDVGRLLKKYRLSLIQHDGAAVQVDQHGTITACRPIEGLNAVDALDWEIDEDVIIFQIVENHYIQADQWELAEDQEELIEQVLNVALPT